MKRNLRTRNKAIDYRKEGHERHTQLLTLLQDALKPLTVQEMADQLGWWTSTVKAYLKEMIDTGQIDEIEIDRKRREYVLLKERREM